MAERMLGIYAEMVDAEELGWTEDSLAEIWKVVAAESDSDACAEALEVIEEEAASEEDCDLGIPFYTERIIALSGERAVVYRLGEQLPPPGPLLSRESVADAEFFEVLRRAGLSVDAPVVPRAVVSELRRASRDVGEEYGLAALDVISVDG
ncbi:MULTISPECIES: hypothetical protein [Streptomyces]|uniref:Uncharacterized protein n=2 Tax=Streptomyces TaxID=1883 RepID=A0ABV9IKK3_9ACTN